MESDPNDAGYNPTNPGGIPMDEIDNVSFLHRRQSATRRFAVLINIWSIILITYGLGSVIYDIFEIFDYERASKHSY